MKAIAYLSKTEAIAYVYPGAWVDIELEDVIKYIG